MHILRNYSALAIVASNAFLVVGMNVAADKNGQLFEGESGQAAKTRNVETYKTDLALVPLARASQSANLDSKDDEAEFLAPLDGQTMVATNSPALKDPEEEGGVEIYTIKDGDTLSSIAAKKKITMNTILWANDIEDVDSIKPGDEIFILPVSGLSYTVKKNDTIEDIAKKYKADKAQIIAFNDLPANGELEEGQDITIPGGEKEQAAPAASSGIAKREYAASNDIAPSTAGKKLDGKAGAGHKFPYGYCTWYVAQKRYVPWGGNAGTWLYHAKAMGYRTGKAPAVGSIVVTTDSAYYGHVAVVEKVSGGTITVSEMNYRGWGKVNKRDIPTNSRKIKGYIY